MHTLKINRRFSSPPSPSHGEGRGEGRLQKLIISALLTIIFFKSSAQVVQPMRYDHYSFTQQANIGVGVARVTAPSAYLEVGPAAAGNKGLLIPRVSTTLRDAIASPATGLTLYNTTTNRFNYYNGTLWVDPIIDTANKWVNSISRILGKDSLIFYIGGTRYAIKDSVGAGGGSTNSNVGSGYRLAIPGTNNIKTFGQGYGLILDSATANQVGAKFDSATVFPQVRATIHTIYNSNDTLTGNRILEGNGNSLSFDGVNKFKVGANVTASGDYSTAIGSYTIASGISSTAMGNTSSASGNYSTAMGNSTLASGEFSTAIGVSTTASGDNSTAMNGSTIASGISSTAMGVGTIASGTSSTAMGYITKAKSYSGTVVGSFNDSTNATDPTAFNVLNRAFQIGIGTADGARANAMTVLFNGNVGIGTVSPTEALEVVGNIRFSGALMPNNTAGTNGQVLTSAGAGVVPTWATPSAGTVTNVTGTEPVQSTGGTTPVISMKKASITDSGWVDNITQSFSGQKTFTDSITYLKNTKFVDNGSRMRISPPGGEMEIYTAGQTQNFLIRNSNATDGISFDAENRTIYSAASSLNVIGGTTTTSTLNLQSTSGVGAAGTAISFRVGNSGATVAQTILNSGNIGIGTSSPDASALLDITSTTKGMLAPRMNTTQQNAISAPASGLLIYNTDSLAFRWYNGSAWTSFGTGGGSGITSINSLTPASQTLAVGTAGTDFAISSATSTHTFNLPTASGSNRGALSTSDWTTFNNKVPTTTSISTGYGITGGGDFSTNRTHILDSATLYLTALRRKDSLTATNLLGYVTRTSLHDSIDALGTISAATTGVPIAKTTGSNLFIKRLGSGTNTTAVAVDDSTVRVDLSGTVGAANGGTGVANNAAMTVTGSGNFAYTRTLTGTTNVTFPVSGTLATLAGSEALTNKTYNGNTFTAGTGILTIGASKTATFNNTISFSGTDATVMTFPSTSATIARTDAANTFTGVQSFLSNPVLNTTSTIGHVWTASGTGGQGGWAAVGGSGYTNLTQFVDQTAWRVFYSNGSGDVTELALGADGTYLKSNGASSAPTFATPAGSGDVTKVGAPVDNQIGVWTGNGTIEGTTDFTFASSTLNIGVNTTTLGKVKMFGNTSGDATLQPAAVAGTATVLTLPSVTGTLSTLAGTETLTNKRWTARVGSTTSSATPTINTDNVDIYKLTAQAADITSMTTNLSGTPVDGDILEIQITGTAARAITWGASFVSSTVTLPTTTVTTATLTIVLQYYTTSSYGNNKWVCVNSF